MPVGERGEIGDMTGEDATPNDPDDMLRLNEADGKSGDLASSAPEADWPDVEPLRRREAGLGRAKAAAPPKAKEDGGLPLPAARIRAERGDSFLLASERVFTRCPGRGGRGRSDRSGRLVCDRADGNGMGGAELWRSPRRPGRGGCSSSEELLESEGERIRSDSRRLGFFGLGVFSWSCRKEFGGSEAE